MSIDYWGTTELRWGQGGARKLGKHCLQSPLCTEGGWQETIGRLEDWFGGQVLGTVHNFG